MARFKFTLIIDDNEMDNFVISTMLERVNFSDNVQTVTSAYKGLELIQSLFRKSYFNPLLPDEICIFLDILMPFMNGNDFLKSLAKINSALVSQVYVLSNLALHDHDKYITIKGIAGNIVKPLTEEKITSLLLPGQEQNFTTPESNHLEIGK